MTNTRRALGALLLCTTLVGGLAGCSDDAAPTPAQSTDAADFRVPLTFRPPPAQRYRLATRQPDAMHWLPHDVVQDDAAERWADLALYTVLRVHDPESGEPLAGEAEEAALRDLPAWFRANPTLTVLAERRVDVAGRRGFQFDIRGTGARVVGSTPFEALELGEAERFTFWKVDGFWLCLQASTLRGPGALTAEEKGDVYDRVLRTMRTT